MVGKKISRCYRNTNHRGGGSANPYHSLRSAEPSHYAHNSIRTPTHHPSTDTCRDMHIQQPWHAYSWGYGRTCHTLDSQTQLKFLHHKHDKHVFLRLPQLSAIAVAWVHGWLVVGILHAAVSGRLGVHMHINMHGPFHDMASKTVLQLKTASYSNSNAKKKHCRNGPAPDEEGAHKPSI